MATYLTNTTFKKCSAVLGFFCVGVYIIGFVIVPVVHDLGHAFGLLH